MGERKSHVKSRHGCMQCKSRRVKCDEQHPACGNCRRRQETCSYKKSTPSIASSPENCNASSTPSQDHVRQLELMHHFCTDTYVTVALPPQGTRMQQIDIPRIAFSNGILLDTIFAVSSLHVAYLRPHEAQWRLADAARYHTRAIAATREHLAKLEASECRAMYHSSVQLGLIALAFCAIDYDSPDATTASETLRQLNMLWRGTWGILVASRDLVTAEDYALFFPEVDWANVPDRAPAAPLDAFLAALKAKAKADPDVSKVEVPSQVGVSSVEDANTGCWVAICKLEVLFQFGEPEPSRVLAYLVQAPQVFWDLVHQRDPLACAIGLLYSITYRVLEDRWWAKGIRNQLADELSPVVAAGDPALAEIAVWVRNLEEQTSTD